MDMPIGVPVAPSKRKHICDENNIIWLDFYNGYGLWIDQSEVLTYGDQIRIADPVGMDILLVVIRTKPIRLRKVQIILFQSKWKTIVPYEKQKEHYTTLGNKV